MSAAENLEIASLEDAGEVSDESFIFKDVMWKIPDFFNLPKQVDSKVQSPSFSFASDTWCLRMYPYGQAKNLSGNNIDLMIVRLTSNIPKHKVSFKLSLKTKRGKKYASIARNQNFYGNKIECVVKRFLPTSRLQRKKDLIAPKNTVTVWCHMHTKKDSVVASTENDENNKCPSSTILQESKILQDFSELLLNEENSDVTIQVKGQKFRAHRAILGARSSVFASMFKSNMKEKATGVVDVEDCEPNIFPDFLHFLYCGNTNKLSVENVFDLYTAADKYDVQDLKSDCVRFMEKNLSIDTFCDIIMLSLQYSEKELLKLATDFFADNLQEIIVTVKWQMFLAKFTVQGNELLIKALVSSKNSKK